MPDFAYQARDTAGTSQAGTISAKDSAEAAVKVRALGLFPTQISTASGKDKPAKTAAPAGQAAGQKIKRIQILLFTREMADMLDAGMPIDRAFSVLVEQMDSDGMRVMMQAMQADIRAGQPFSEALRKYPRLFPSLYVNMIRAGEVSGQLSDVMERLSDFMEKEQVRRSQIMAALTYPAVLLGVATLAITFLLTFVVPKLSGIFHDMGNALPIPTRILLAASGFISQYWLGIVAVAVIGGFSLRTWANTDAGRDSIDRLKLEMPLFGTVAQKIVAARLARTLGTLLAGGVPILESLDISADALGNAISSEALVQVRNGVRQGEMLHEAMEKTSAFLPVVLHMTAVGEETGRLPNMLIRTADTLDFEVDNTMRRLTSLVEPLVVLLMGGFIGFVVLSILLPIFEANNLVK